MNSRTLDRPVRDRESLHFSQAVHDELGQPLTAALMMAEALSGRLSREGSAQTPNAQRLAALIQATLGAVRALPDQLERETFGPGGFIAALQTLADEVRETAGVECRVIARGSFDAGFPQPLIATHLLRIVREAVANALRHGRAERLRLCIAREADQLILVIQDNGCGFDHAAVRHGTGLHSMRYRARLINARLSVRSTLGCGTRFRCRVMI